ncbi:MAG: hypothetical protein N3F09_06375 [Bacteroidia bacterium]|nr:hypothetical protein [Bacteroidia bacterium]
MTSRYLHIPLLFFILLSGACKKDKEVTTTNTIPTPPTANLHIHFSHQADSLTLFPGQSYTLPGNQSYSVDVFKYYISNIELHYTNGNVFKEDYSYHLIDFKGKSEIILNKVPIGKIGLIKFMIGVDSAKNVSGPQTGDLSPSLGMFWSWNTGYIMVKFEGASPQSGDPNKQLVYHIGGFKGLNKAQRTVFITLPSKATMENNKNYELSLITNASRLFYGTHQIDFSTNYFTMSSNKNASDFADNYMHMISYKNFSEQ